MPNESDGGVRVVLIDGQTMIRGGLRLIIESEPGIKVVGEASGRADALAVVARGRPDLILLDLLLGSENGLDLIAELTGAGGGVPVLILTGIDSPRDHSEAIRRGARGVVLKNDSPELLVKAIKAVLAGEVWLDHSLSMRLLREVLRGGDAEQASPEDDKIATLTNREREVVALLGEGLKNRQIADRLFISEVTVRHHLTSVFSKLDVSDRLELAVYAYRVGLAKPPRCDPRWFQGLAPPKLSRPAGGYYG